MEVTAWLSYSTYHRIFQMQHAFSIDFQTCSLHAATLTHSMMTTLRQIPEGCT